MAAEMSVPASNNSRSAPCPERSCSKAASSVARWRTAAPPAAASRAAAMISGRELPTSSSLTAGLGARQVRARSASLDDFGHGDPQMVVHHQHLAARDQAIVDVDLHGLAHLAVELHDRPAAEPQ